MKKTALVCATFVAMISNYSLAQTTNIVAQSVDGADGGNALTDESGGSAANLYGYVGVTISGGSSLTGGNGGSAAFEAGIPLSADGGNALEMDRGTLQVDNSSLIGGDAGTTDSGALSSSIRGGHGAFIHGGAEFEAFSDKVVISGGNGGNHVSSAGSAFVQSYGGDGINYHTTEGDGMPAQTIAFDGGQFSGGDGGDVYYTSDLVAVPTSTENYLGTYFAQVDKFTGARGGHGVRIYNEDYIQYGQVLDISAGMFMGGDGGLSENAGAGDSIADGGHGIFTDFVDINITGGTFVGGAAGTSNGEAANEGYGVFQRDGNLSISGGSFEGKGLWFESHYYDSTATISNGTFGDVSFISTYDEFFITDHITTANIRGGTFEDVVFGGSSFHSGNITAGIFNSIELTGETSSTIDIDGASVGLFKVSSSNGVNVVTSTGTSIDALEISGNSDNTFTLTSAGLGSILVEEGDQNILNINDNGASIGDFTIYEGMATVNFNAAHSIGDVYVSNATLTVTGTDLSVGAGRSYQMVSEMAAFNVEGLVVDGGTLDVGRGALTVSSDLTVKSGSGLVSALAGDGAGVKVGEMNAASIEIEDNVSWTVINTDTNVTADNFSGGILLASATDTDIIHSLDFSDFTLENNPEWLLGINGVTNEFDGSSYNLVASYGELNFIKVFEDYPDLQPALEQLAPMIETNDALREYMGGAWNDVQAASTDIGEGFVRTPEMANALIGLQSVFADQIKSRTRSNLRYKNFGSKTTYAPAGPRGPEGYDNAVQWTEEALPTWNAKDDMRKVSDRAPTVGGNSTGGSKSYESSSAGSPSEPIKLPETWQVWGGAYGSSIKQDSTTGHVGYRGSIVGGMIAMDKRFEKMLMGLGAGYARTVVDGNEGNDGDADTLHATAYWAHNTESFYVDASLTYGYNDVSTEGVETIGYEADYDAHTLGIGIGVGYGISFAKDKWLLTPEASYLGTMFNRGEYTEKSNLVTPFPDKEYESYNQWSHLTSIGATLSTVGVIENFRTQFEYQPEFRLHWLHEFNADMEDDSYLLVGGTGDPIAVALQAREEDLIRLGTGIRFSEWGNDTTEFSLDLDGAIGADYQNYIVSGKILHRF